MNQSILNDLSWLKSTLEYYTYLLTFTDKSHHRSSEYMQETRLGISKSLEVQALAYSCDFRSENIKEEGIVTVFQLLQHHYMWNPEKLYWLSQKYAFTEIAFLFCREIHFMTLGLHRSSFRPLPTQGRRPCLLSWKISAYSLWYLTVYWLLWESYG